MHEPLRQNNLLRLRYLPAAAWLRGWPTDRIRLGLHGMGVDRMRERGIYEGPVYHLFAGSDMAEVKVCNSYPEYLAYYAELRKQGKGTRYGAIWLDRKARIYHYYFRVVDEK